VLGLCAHLLGDDLGWLARDRDRHLGTPPPSADEAGFVRWLDELQLEWVRALRRLSPRLVTELLGWSGPPVVAALQQQDPDRLSGSVGWAAKGPVPLWLDQLREVSEQWIHRQQLLQALGRRSDLRPDLAGPVLDGLRWAYPFRLGRISAAAGNTVTITVRGPVSRTWHLVAGEDGWRYRGRPGPQVIATMELTTQQAWRLLTNNLRAGARDQLSRSGSPQILDVLLNTRAIIGAPQWAEDDPPPSPLS
jgi:hypothetical protein